MTQPPEAPYGPAANGTPASAPDTTAVAPPVASAPGAPPAEVWHSIPLLIGLGVFTLLAAIATGIGGAGFPINAPVEQIYVIGIIIDLGAVTVVMTILTIVEFRRRADPRLRALPPDTGRSALAITAVVMAGVTLLAWGFGGIGQLIDLAQGVRVRYMFHTGGLFLAGAPWVLSMVFGAWGLRTPGHRITNILAAVAICVGVLLAVDTAAAALIYGAGRSD
jgi:hypothetical protein